MTMTEVKSASTRRAALLTIMSDLVLIRFNSGGWRPKELALIAQLHVCFVVRQVIIRRRFCDMSTNCFSLLLPQQTSRHVR